MSAESMSMTGLKGKEELFVPGAQENGEQNERDEEGRAIRRNHDGSLVPRNVFFFLRVESGRKRGSVRVVKTVTCLAFMLAFLLKKPLSGGVSSARGGQEAIRK